MRNHLGSYEFKIGRPGYRVTKQFDPDTKQRSLLFQIEYPEIEDLGPTCFMSSFEQRVEKWDKRYQFLLFAAGTCMRLLPSRCVPSTEIDKSTPKFFSHWDPDSKMFTLQLYFKVKPPEANKPPSANGPANGTAAPGVPPRPLPPQPQALPPPPPQGNPPGGFANPPRGPPPGSVPPPPPMSSANGPRPMPPGGSYQFLHLFSWERYDGKFYSLAPKWVKPMMMMPPQGFPGQQMLPPPANMGQQMQRPPMPQ
ncbi:hypothetical protein MKW92_025612 [Papaver armeniacum]|nr:hypothetical protein MKW92_025612 [Papaver armeniacum]